MDTRAMLRSGLSLVVMCALGLALLGCSSDTATSDSEAEFGGSESWAETGTPAVPVPDDIRPGREIAEGGGGPTQYTFREEWRRALAEAGTWREGAYLITAIGDFVNDEGVPSNWTMTFVDSPEPDAILLLDVDPWGNVTNRREVVGDEVYTHVNQFSAPIPVDVIDSDAAVTAGIESLSGSLDIAQTQDPRIGLGFNDLDGTGPYWTYTVFYKPTASYASVLVDALTGEARPQ